jgi:hypothetical protein
MESITVHNGENFVYYPKVNIMDNGELSFEIEKEEPSFEIEKKESSFEIEKEEPLSETKNKPKKDCIKYISTCTST